jgi:hypothetical protein
MSARALPACTFALAAEQTAAAGRHAPEGSDAEIQFREDLWREFLREALVAGLSAAQATEYASALSSAKGQVEGVSEMAPAGRNWFYQSRAVVVRRTITSSLLWVCALGKKHGDRANRSRRRLSTSPPFPLVDRGK